MPERALLGTMLTADGALTLAVGPRVRAPVDAWLPRHLALAGWPGDASITVHEAPSAEPDDPPGDAEGAIVATFGPVAVRAVASGLRFETRSSARGRVDAASGRAALAYDPGSPGDAGAVEAMLTLAAATLLGRMERVLIHAAAVVAPDGRAWLLAGDTHAGKSTTCATLLDAGWRYCSDDQAILSDDGAGGLRVEGWPRVLHLDRGWADGQPAGGPRTDVDAFARWPGRWLSSAPVGGVLLPSVVADAPSRLVPATSADRLVMLVRQAPWLFVETGGAPAALALLRRAALLPGSGLRLGRDTFREADRLQAVLAEVTGGSGSAGR